jgi:hypothetical protein
MSRVIVRVLEGDREGPEGVWEKIVEGVREDCRRMVERVVE